MIGIGIDTGGTCTDAVIYDLERNQILAAAKTLTTKEDLKQGIEAVLEQLPQALLEQCGQIALSTTLATNACVENRGGHGKLILLGVNEKVFDETHASYGIEHPDDVMLVPCSLTIDQSACTPPDWDAFRAALPGFLEDCDCVSIVQLFSADYRGSFEKKAAEIIRELEDIPIILGNTLFPDRNAIRRGAGSLLNARLIPVLQEFLVAIRAVFTRRGMQLPIVIIRSDGSQMSEQFAAGRPVETLLCGPAASVIGAGELSGEGEAMIIDIGGTTTDISIIRGGIPKRAENGINVGNWKTFVKGLFVDTFGFGGDTAIHYTFGGSLYLEQYRVIPLCSLAARYPQVEEELRKLAASGRHHSYYLHEFLTLQKQPDPGHGYSAEELALCAALAKGPLSLEQAAEAMGKDVYTMHVETLEQDGVIMRAGLTPTDLMHIRGEYTAFRTPAAQYAAQFVARSANLKKKWVPRGEELLADPAAAARKEREFVLQSLSDEVYDLIEKRLYENILRILITAECPPFADRKLDAQMQELIDLHYQMAKDGTDENAFFAPVFRLRGKLVGVGAPTHIFLPRVAKLLHTEAVIPEHASVANAVGAIAGKVLAQIRIELRPYMADEATGYEVVAGEENKVFETYGEALAWAKESGAETASGRVREQGAAGKITVTYEVQRKEATIDLGTQMWLSDTVTVTASGNPVGAVFL